MSTRKREEKETWRLKDVWNEGGGGTNVMTGAVPEV